MGHKKQSPVLPPTPPVPRLLSRAALARGSFCLSFRSPSTFLHSLRSIPVTGFHRYYGCSDSCRSLSDPGAGLPDSRV